MLAAIGLDRTQVYIANVVPWRPPGNRTPTPQETSVCLPFVRRQIELVDPDILVCLGGAAATTLIGHQGRHHVGPRPLDGLRARCPQARRPRVIPSIATLHPAYLLRQPIHKRFAWRDLREIRRRLDQLRVTAQPEPFHSPQTNARATVS